MSMYGRGSGPLYVAAIAGALGSQVIQAHAACNSAAYPGAAVAAKTWVDARRIDIPPDIQATILSAFCEAADTLAAEKGVTSNVLDQKAQAVIAEYLDRSVDPKRPARSMNAILRSALGATGFSRPEQKIYGVVRVTYSHPIDSLQIGSQNFPPWTAMLVSVGQSQLVGRNRSIEVCRMDLNVTSTTDIQITC